MTTVPADPVRVQLSHHCLHGRHFVCAAFYGGQACQCSCGHITTGDLQAAAEALAIYHREQTA